MAWNTGDWVRFIHTSWPIELTGMLGQITGIDSVFGQRIVRFHHNQRIYSCKTNELVPVTEREALTEIAAHALLGPQDRVKIVRPPTFGVKP